MVRELEAGGAEVTNAFVEFMKQSVQENYPKSNTEAQEGFKKTPENSG